MKNDPKKAIVTQWIDDTVYRQILENVPIACVDIAIVSNGAHIPMSPGV